LIYDEKLDVTMRWYDPSSLSDIICLPLSDISVERRLYYIQQRDTYLQDANFIYDPKYLQKCDWHRPETMVQGRITQDIQHACSLSWTMNPGFPQVTSVVETVANGPNGRPVRECTKKNVQSGAIYYLFLVLL
jgi:hypothetical protein